MRFLPFAILATSLLVPSTSDADEKSELKKLKGTYKTVSLKVGGKAAPPVALKTKFSIDGNVFTIISYRNEMAFKLPLTAKLDDSKSPKHMTLSRSGMPLLEGIYKLEKKKLTLCFSRAGTGRPTKFESKKGTRVTLQVLEKSN